MKPFQVVVLATLMGCSTSTIPGAMVKEQVKSCLESKRVGNTTFSERFTIRDVTVKDWVVTDPASTFRRVERFGIGPPSYRDRA